MRQEKKPRYLCNGADNSHRVSTWKRVDSRGDYLEFLHFTAFDRGSFSELVNLCSVYIESHPIDPRFNAPPK